MVVRRILALVLCFVLGFLACIGTIVGAGYLIYSKVSLDWLNDKGIVNVDSSSFLDAEAEVDLSAMTLAGMVEELKRLSTKGDQVTVDMLIERYGLTLPEGFDKLIPDGARTVPVTALLSDEGISYVLENTEVDYLFTFLPEDLLSTPAKEALAGKTLRQVVDLDLEGLLRGVRVGYLLGVKYEVDGDGAYVPVYADPSRPTLVEAVSAVDLGQVLEIIGDGGDAYRVADECLGDVMVELVVNSVMDLGSTPLSGVFDGLTFDELLVYDEKTGTYLISVGAILNGRMLGEILGYTPVYAAGSDTVILEWRDGNGEKVTGILRGLAGVRPELKDGEEFDYMELAADVLLGDVMGYTPTLDLVSGEVIAWHDANGDPIKGIEEKVAALTVGELTGGTFSFASVLDGMFVGDLLGYDKTEDGWEDGGKPVEGIDGAVADIDLGRLMDPDEEYQITDALGDLSIGAILGCEESGDVWLDKVTGEPVDKLYEKIYDLTVSEMMADDFSFDAVFEGLLLGDALGYDKTEDGWEDNGTAVEGLDAALADIDLGKLLDPESDYKVTDALTDLCIGDILGCEESSDDVWLDKATGKPVSALYEKIYDLTVGQMMADDFSFNEVFEGMLLGEVLGYEKAELPDGTAEWYETVEKTDGAGNPILGPDGEPETERKPVLGIDGAIANIDLGKMLDSESNYEITEVFDTVYVGEILEYEKVELPDGTLEWYETVEKTDGAGDPILGPDGEPETERKLVTGVAAKFSGYFLGDLMNGRVDLSADGIAGDLTIGEIMGYDPVYKTDGAGDPVLGEDGEAVVDHWKKDGEKVSGVMGAIAGFLVSELDTKVNTVKIGELLDYTYDGEKSAWVDAEGAAASGIMAAFVSLSVEDMKNSETVTAQVKTITVGDAMGYYLCKENGVWYRSFSESAGYSEPVTGTMKALAGKTIGELETSVDDMMVGEVMGYTPVYKTGADGEYELDGDGNRILTDWLTDAGSSVPVGSMRAISHIRIKDLDDPEKGIDSVKIGDILGYTPVYQAGSTTEVEYWEDANSERASGVMVAFAELTIGQMKDNDAVTTRVKTIKIGEAMGYEWGEYYEHGVLHTGWLTDDETTPDPSDKKPVKGTMKTLANKTIGELDDEEKGLGSFLVGEVLGYEKHDGVWYEDYEAGIKWENVTMLAIADLTVTELDCTDSNQGLGHVYIGSFLGYTPHYKLDGGGNTILDSDGYPIVDYWTDGEGNAPSGVMASFASLTLNQMQSNTAVSSAAKNILIGDVMDYVYVDSTDDGADNGVWYSSYVSESENTPVTGFMKSVAGKRVGEMNGLMNELSVADVMGYTPSTGGGYTDESGNPVSGVMLAIAGYRVSELGTKINDVHIGQVMGYSKTASGWIDAGGKKPNGLMAEFADLTIGSMSDADEVIGAVQRVTVGDAMGYYYDTANGVWCTDSDTLTPVTGVMRAIAGSQIGGLKDDLDGTPVGDILGYTYVAAEDQWYNGSEPCSTLVNTICRSSLGTLGSTMTNLTVKDMFSAEDRSKGFLSLIDEDTRLADIGSTINTVFETTRMGQYVGFAIIGGSGTASDPYVYSVSYDANNKTTGILSFPKSTVEKLDRIDLLLGGDWKNCTITGFVDYIASLAP